MRILSLVDNCCASDAFRSEHGMSLYVETEKHKLLFDTGCSDLFMHNAQKLGIDLALIDIAILSHGHADHGGGLHAFFRVNGHAPVYVRKEAFGEYYSQRTDGIVYIGLEKELIANHRLMFTGNTECIDETVSLFSAVQGDTLLPQCNHTLLVKEQGILTKDRFAHEQYLVVREQYQTVLFTGCAHKGIINIIEGFYAQYQCYPDTVVGGFHLTNSSGKIEERERIEALALRLAEYDIKYLTCHCTSWHAYTQLRELLGEKIQYLAAGSAVII